MGWRLVRGGSGSVDTVPIPQGFITLTPSSVRMVCLVRLKQHLAGCVRLRASVEYVTLTLPLTPNPNP
jgi:hypothetical protein